METNATINRKKKIVDLPLKSLDLFSGIGGFARGLRFISDTVAFCDLSVRSCAVLATNKALKGVPIIPDVTKIDKSVLQELSPNMITGGFPCQDISSMKMIKEGEVRAGLDGPRSKLFFEIPRIVREAKGTIKHVFLENSPRMVGPDSDRVIEELQKVGLYHIAYGIFSAADVGALQVRKRWFCLASSRPQDLPLMDHEQLNKAIFHTWTKDVPRVIPLPKDPKAKVSFLHRNSLLGNSVVPQVVAFAYQNLATVLRESPRSVKSLLSQMQSNPKQEKQSKSLPKLGSIVLVITDPKRKNELARGGIANNDNNETPHEIRRTIRRPSLSVNPPMPPKLDFVMKNSDGKSPQRIPKKWQTPRHSKETWYQTRKLNDRALWNLANGIYYEVGTRKHCPQAGDDINNMADYCTINPRFVENLMGYPMDWTKTDPNTKYPPPCDKTHSFLKKKTTVLPKCTREEEKHYMSNGKNV